MGNGQAATHDEPKIEDVDPEECEQGELQMHMYSAIVRLCRWATRIERKVDRHRGVLVVETADGGEEYVDLQPIYRTYEMASDFHELVFETVPRHFRGWVADVLKWMKRLTALMAAAGVIYLLVWLAPVDMESVRAFMEFIGGIT